MAHAACRGGMAAGVPPQLPDNAAFERTHMGHLNGDIHDNGSWHGHDERRSVPCEAMAMTDGTIRMGIVIDGEWFEKLTCGNCGIIFYAPQHWIECRRDRGDHDKRFYCPNGHSRIWSVPEIDIIRRERDLLKQQTARLEDEKREIEARVKKEERRAARIKRRAMAALCPCCNRHFSQMERHMKMKHPDVVAFPKKLALP